MSQQKDNSGALFKNDRRREGKEDPTHQGSCTIEGKDYWISAWVNESQKDGSRYFGLRFKPKDAKAAGAKPAEPEKAQAEFDDDIPF